jgi:hypothetical protein
VWSIITDLLIRRGMGKGLREKKSEINVLTLSPGCVGIETKCKWADWRYREIGVFRKGSGDVRDIVAGMALMNE